MTYGVAASSGNVIPFPVRPDPEPPEDDDPEPTTAGADDAVNRVESTGTDVCRCPESCHKRAA